MTRFCPALLAHASLVHVLLAGTLAACSSSPPAPPPGPDPAPDHRRLIAENVKTLFAPDAQVRNVMISGLSQVPTPAGLAWGTCVRVSATGMSGNAIPPRTYVVTFSRNTIAERRPAGGSDCAGAVFEPLGR